MKKYFLILIVISFFTSCEEVCYIDSAEITRLSNQITVLEDRIKASNSQGQIALWLKDIEDLEDRITEEARACD